MKSAHKLGAALATFILLSVVAYFTITSLHEATLKSQAPVLDRPGNANTTASSQQMASSSVSTPAISTSGPSGGSSASGSSETPESASTTTAATTPTTTTTTTPSPTTTPPMAAPTSSSEAAEMASGAPTTQAPTTTTQTPTSPTVESVATSEPTSEPSSTIQSLPTEQSISTSALYSEKTRQPLGDPPSADELEKWAQFKTKYMKAYPDSRAESERMSVFIGNLRFISAFNNLKDVPFTLDVNRFADLTQNETNALFIGPQHVPVQLSPPDSRLRILPDNEQVVNRSADWSHLLTGGGPTEQGNCLDSAIFALVASLESTLNAAGGNKAKLSEQQLIDCMSLHLAGANGMPPVCSGRLTMTDILMALESPALRLSTFQDYHQFKLAVAAGQAPPNQCVAPAHPETRPYVQSHVTVPHENIEEALQNSGPLVVALDASQPTFHFYKSGVYHDLQCSPDNSNFYALLVAQSTGQAQSDQQPATESAYRIRASLGPDWGEGGFARLSSDPQRNKCGPQGVAIYPNVGFE